MIVWNDPVNLMTYVVYVFQKLFGYSRKKATQLMRQVHEEGKAVVSDGTRREVRGRRRPPPRARPLGHDGTPVVVRLTDGRWKRFRTGRTTRSSSRCAEEELGAAAPLPDQLREVFEGDGATIRRAAGCSRARTSTRPRRARRRSGRRSSHPSLLRERLDALELVTATLGAARAAGDWWQIALTPDEVQAWLGVLNDTRLVLGTRLGVTEEERELDPADPEAGAYALYQWLTWFQGDLVEELL